MPKQQYQVEISRYPNYVRADPDDPDSEDVEDGTYTVFSIVWVGNRLQVRAIAKNRTREAASATAHTWWVELKLEEARGEPCNAGSALTPHTLTQVEAMGLATRLRTQVDAWEVSGEQDVWACAAWCRQAIDRMQHPKQ